MCIVPGYAESKLKNCDNIDACLTLHKYLYIGVFAPTSGLAQVIVATNKESKLARLSQPEG